MGLNWRSCLQPKGKITIETVGVPRVTGKEGANLTPVGSRNRAILVVLALSPRMTVGRRWLEALLWSDRSAEQASGSLRQALASIRRQLGEARDLLHASRTDVWLQSNQVNVDLVDATDDVFRSLQSGREFLEGIDIESEAFEDWLRQERAWLHDQLENYWQKKNSTATAVSTVPKPRAPLPEPPPQRVGWSEPPILYLDAEAGVSPDKLEMFMTDTICTQLTQTVMCHFRADVRALDGNLQRSIVTPGARCVIRVVKVNGTYTVRARMTEEPIGKVFWARQIFVDGKDNLAMLDAAAAISTEACEAMAMKQNVASSAQNANAMAAKALGDVFSFDPDRLRSAIIDLTEANELDPHAPRPALKALALAFLALETQSEDRAYVEAQVTELIQKSHALGPENALAMSFLADVHDLVFEDSQTALSYAKSALHNNPGIGYAYASLGALELRRGETEAALRAANRAQRQLQNSSLEVFSLMRLCVANMTTHNFEVAEQAALRAAELAPTSQPPLRHLYALRLRRKDTSGAQAALKSLRRLDPTFSMQFLRENPDFKAATLRNLQLHKLKDVEV